VSIRVHPWLPIPDFVLDTDYTDFHGMNLRHGRTAEHRLPSWSAVAMTPLLNSEAA
jgi:hypothetical protein